MVDWNLTCELAVNQTVDVRSVNIVSWSAVTVRPSRSAIRSPRVTPPAGVVLLLRGHCKRCRRLPLAALVAGMQSALMEHVLSPSLRHCTFVTSCACTHASAPQHSSAA
jgi:hypothetical protein